MRILIIEDEIRAANQLQMMLKACDFHYHLLDIIDSIEDSVSWFKKNETPDLVFMDIQLADGLSFEIFQQVKVRAPIIFTTAFDQYAIQAFKVNSVDYVLKPIQRVDIQFALDKFLDSKETKQVEPEILKQLMQSMLSKTQRSGVLVKEGSGFIQIKVADLLYVYSDGGLTFGVSSTNRYIIEETLDKFYESLDSNDFFKINRGQIVNKNAIVKINPYFSHRVKLNVMHPRDQEFIVSRQKTAEFKKWMNT
ncbi:MAG: LytTR family DNA-binding domain-containing protein [Saprospiraceae bacterium]|nr:LytTR family DNA-binding domain-containing protein [Saprospiraceae bacterium]